MTTPEIDPIDELPNDPAFLKERIARQNHLLGCYAVEIDILKDNSRHLKRKIQKLKELLTPQN